MINGISMEDAIRDINTFMETRQKRAPFRADVETFATVLAVYDDWTVDIALGTPQSNGAVTGRQYKRVPVAVSLGDAGKGYGDFDLPQKGSTVLIRLIHNRTVPIVLGKGVYFSPRVKNQTYEQRNVTSNVKAYFTDTADKGYVHQSGTKWKVKKNGDWEIVNASGNVTVKVVGDVLSIVNGSNVLVEVKGTQVHLKNGTIEMTVGSTTIDLGTGALEALVKGASFQTLYNAHVHVVTDPVSGPLTSAAPLVPMGSSQLTTKVQGV